MNDRTVRIRHKYDWEVINNTFVRGHAFINGKYYSEKELCKHISGLRLDQIRDAIENIEGYFSIIKIFDDTVFAATDRVGSIPLFYRLDGSKFTISDSSRELRNGDKIELDKTALNEYLVFRFPLGNSTLLTNVNQIQAGEYIIVKNNPSYVTKKYYTHSLHIDDEKDESIKVRLDSEIQEVMDRIEQIAKQKQIILPLSGGYDSRLLITMLDQSDIDNVKTYTVATEGGLNPDLKVAQDVADQFDFEWRPVYVSQSDYRDFIESDEWVKYNDFTGAVGGLPGLRDLTAVRELEDSSYIASNAIFIPGHTAIDTSKATPQYKESPDMGKIAKDIFNSLHISWDIEAELKKSIIDSIRRDLQSYKSDSPGELFERYRLEERRSKRILRYGMTYRYHGYKFWYPLQDPILMDFWKEIPNSFKNGKEIYKEYITNRYSELTGKWHRVAGQSRWKHLGREKFEDTFIYPALKLANSYLNSSSDDSGGLSKYDAYAENGIVPRQKYLAIKREVGDSLYGDKSVEDLYPLMITYNGWSDSNYELNYPPEGIITKDWIVNEAYGARAQFE